MIARFIAWVISLWGGTAQREADAEKVVKEAADAQATDTTVDRLSDAELVDRLSKYERDR